MHALIEKKLQEHQAQQLFRERRIKPTGLCFASNDYLGLAQDPAVLEALCDGAMQYGLGATGSALISGYSKPHAKLERDFAAYLQRDRALLFSNGYLANAAVQQALLGRKDTVFQDKRNHASIIDGAKLAGATLKRYQHGDMQDLERLLLAADKGLKMIATDHVFSMQGDLAPITELVRLAKQYEAVLMVDDAHGLGVIDFSYSQKDVPVLVCPLGKALGTGGAIVAGSNDFIEALIQFARPYMFNTAISPAIAHAMNTALEIMQNQTWRREKLHDNIAYFKEIARQNNIPILESNTGIQMIPIGDNLKAQALSDALFKKRLFVGAVRPPSVPINQAALRITLSSMHEQPEIAFLLKQMAVLL